MKIIANDIEFNSIIDRLTAGTDINGVLSIDQVIEYIESIYFTLDDANSADPLKTYIRDSLEDLATLQAVYDNTLKNTFNAIVALPTATEAELSSVKNYLDFAINFILEISENVATNLDPTNPDVAQLLNNLDNDKTALNGKLRAILDQLLQDLLNVHSVVKDTTAKNNLLFTHKQLFLYEAKIQKQAPTLGQELLNVLNALEKIESAKEGSTVTVDSVEQAREIVEQGGMAEVANHVSIHDQNTCHNIAKTDHNAYRSIINRHCA